MFVENCQFSNKECAAISRFVVKNGQISNKERGVPCRPCRVGRVADSLFRPHPEQRARASREPKCVNLVDLVKGFQTNIYLVLLAKFGVDTAENGPLKVCQKLANR